MSKYKRKIEPLAPNDPRAKNMRAAIYSRKSTETEGRSRSRDEQNEFCERYAKLFGFTDVTIYMEEEGQKGDWWWEDRQMSYNGPHRPELTKLINDISSGAIQAVLVYKNDRLARDSGIADALHKIFRTHCVHYICNGIDASIDTARGLYAASVESAASRQWRDNISEEIRRDHDYKFQLRKFTRNPACFGFRSAGRGTGRAIPQYKELALVRRIYRMFLGIGTPALGPYQIGNVLSKEGISVTSGCKGHKTKGLERVQGTSIKQILENSMYAGLWVHNGERAFYDLLLVEPEDGVGEKTTAIPETWYYQAQAKFEQSAPTGRKAATSTRMLSGLVVCGACGRVCHPNTKNVKNGLKIHRWICPYRYGATKCCFGNSYSTLVTNELDSWAIDHLIPFLARELNLINSEGQGLDLANKKKELEHQVAAAKNKEIEALKTALGVIDKDQFEILAQSLLDDRKDLERKLMDVNSQLGNHNHAFFKPEDLLSNDPKLIKEALKRFIKWIALTDKGITVLTSLGTYFGAEFKEVDMTRFRGINNRRSVLPPSLTSTANCLSWISNHNAFLAGRRDALGSKAKHKTDQDLLPGAQLEEKHAA